MAHFHGLCHGNCALRYVGGDVGVKKLVFWGLKGQFDVKMARFRGLTVKIGYLSPILATRTPLLPVFLEYAIGIMIEGMLERFSCSES